MYCKSVHLSRNIDAPVRVNMPIRLLIVDDDQEISGLMRLKLSREAPHFTIAIVDGGRECLEYVKGEGVDCILSDYQMPGMNGMELLKSLRRQGNFVPFIFLTGQGNEELAREAFKNGAYDYFTKEIGFAHFARIINSVEQAVKQAAAERDKAAFESALLDREARHKAIINAFPDMVFMLNQEGVFLDMSVRDAHALYAPKDKVVGRSLSELMPPEVAATASLHLRMLFETTEIQEFKYNLAMPDGVREYEARMVVIGTDEALCIVRDVTEREEAVTAMRESESRFRSMAEDAVAGISIIQDGKFVYVNPRLAGMFGYAQDEIIGKMGAEDVTLPEDREMVRENIRKRLEGEVKSIHYRLRCVRKDKKVISVEVYGSHTMYRGKPAVISTLLDITEQKRAEEERLSNLWFLESLERVDRAIRQAESLDDMMSDVLDTALSIFESDRAWLLYPCDPEAPLWRVPMERTRAGYPGALDMGIDIPITPEVRQAFLEGLNSSGPVVYDPQSGRSLPQVSMQFSVQSQVQTVVYPTMGKPWVFGMHQCSYARVWSEKDVRLFTEIARRLADGLSVLLFLRDLRESEEHFRQLTKQFPVPIAINNDIGGIEYLNDRFIETFGYTLDDIPTLDAWWPLAYPGEQYRREAMDTWRNAAEKAVLENADIETNEYRTTCKDGTIRIVEMFGTRIGNKNLILLNDVTERKRAEEDRTGLFHMLTHDIKGPLTIIYGYAQMLAVKLDKDRANMAGEIKNAARRISSLIDDMLILSSMESPGFRLSLGAVALDDVLDQAVKENQMPASDIDVKIGLDIEDGIPRLLADKMQLVRVFGNLVGNAVKYNRHGGMVQVRAWTNGNPSGHVMVEVKDTGVGIHEDDLPHVFDKYYRGRSTGAARGTGLGLAVVKAIVEAHGGVVSVASKEMEGSTFSVALPVKMG